MIKVVYFDDFSATDYVNIYDGGSKVITSEEIKDKSKEFASKTSYAQHVRKINEWVGNFSQS